MKHLVLLLLLVSASASEDKTLGMSEASSASSCNTISSTILLSISQCLYMYLHKWQLIKVKCNIKLNC